MWLTAYPVLVLARMKTGCGGDQDEELFCRVLWKVCHAQTYLSSSLCVSILSDSQTVRGTPNTLFNSILFNLSQLDMIVK